MIYKMKLWQKIFIVSFITSIFLFAFCGIFITVSGHKLNFNFEKNNFERNLNIFIGEIKISSNELNTDIFFNGLLKNINDENYFLTVYDGDKIIFNNLESKRQKPRYELISKQEREKVYMEVVERKNYFTSEVKVNILNKELKIFFSKDISHIYEICNQQLERLFLICGVLSIIAACIMLLTSKILTMPITNLNEAINHVAKNDYSYRLPVNNLDELNMLSNSFNTMCEAVEKNISNYKSAINNFTHEVKTPLTSIIGYAGIINSSQFPEKAKEEAAEYILKESRRLNSLINRIVSFLTVDKEIKKEKISLKEILEMSCLSVKAKAESKEITIFKYECENIFVYGDEELLTVLIVNLLDNAIKASYIGGKIEISFLASKGILKQLSIQDYGIGMPENEIPNIVEVFYKIDKSRKNIDNGLGLGLAICTEILKSHNARLSISSKLGEGTKVIINFENII